MIKTEKLSMLFTTEEVQTKALMSPYRWNKENL